jgi:hypothetical protein
MFSSHNFSQCLLHAQRLVPNSCAVITSTVRGSSSITRAKFVVDMARDSVICVEKSNTEKENTESSGTSITLLLPVSVHQRPTSVSACISKSMTSTNINI